jgi:8-oxo-dGTP diphosphatase
VLGLPAGSLERDENAEEAAARELKEETGLHLDPESLELLKNVDVVHPNGRHNLLAIYKVDYSKVEGEPEAGTDASSVSFRKTDEIQKEALSLEKAREKGLME